MDIAVGVAHKLEVFGNDLVQEQEWICGRDLVAEW